MASFPAVTMTTEGLNMIAKASSGNSEDRLIVIKVKFGDGVSEGNIREYTDVISPKMEVTLAEWEDRGDGRFRYTFIYNNSGIKTGFYHREIGLFAKNGDSGTEKLIAYSNAGSFPGYISDETKEIPYQKLMINIGIGDTDNVTGEVDISNAVTIEKLNKHNDDSEAHANLIKHIFNVSDNNLDSVKSKIEYWAKEVCLPLSGGNMTGAVKLFANSTIITPPKNDNTTKIATTEWVQMCINYYINNLKLKKILDMFLDFKKIYDVLITPLGIVVVKNTICIEDKMFNKKINKNKLILTVKEG